MSARRYIFGGPQLRTPGGRWPVGLLLAGAVLAMPLAWAVAQPGQAPAPTAAPAAQAAPAKVEPPSQPAAAPPPAPAGSAAEAAPTGQAPPAAEGAAPGSPPPAATEGAAQPGQPPAAAAAQGAAQAPAAAEGTAPPPAAPAASAVAEPAHEPAAPAAAGEAHPEVEKRMAAENEVGEGHAHAEPGPLIENWWSWDFGPGKTHRHPPFGFALINFVVFLYLLNRLVGKDFRGFMLARHTDVRKALDRAREVEAKAQEQLRHFEERTKAVDAEIAALLAAFAKQAEAERQSIIARAESDAQKLLRDAEAQVQVALDAARRELEQKAALLAVDLAEKLIVSRVTDADQHRLVDRYLAQVESLVKPGPAPEGRP